MPRTLLIGIDGSSYSDAAVGLGIDWARHFDAMLVGLGIVDQPGICAPEPVPLGAGSFKEMLDSGRLHEAYRRIEQALERFVLRCTEAGVASKPLEDVGDPAERLALEAQRYDLILLGQKTFFRNTGEPSEALHSVLRNAPRPVVVVPETPQPGRNVLVAYDGSRQATRALQLYLASGLAGYFDQTHVLCIHPDGVEAARRANRAVEFLGFHDVKAQLHETASHGRPADLLLGQIEALSAGLLVMGCYGEPTLREFFLGSATQSMLQLAQVPLFLYH